jgi:nucleoside-diphosphate-sugar epimerase
LYGRAGEKEMQIFDANTRFGVLLLSCLSEIKHPISFINCGTILDSDISHYALSKNQFIEWGNSIAKETSSNIQFINAILQHMYGPKDDLSKFTTLVIKTCLNNEPYLNITSGMQKRDFIYIKDVVMVFSKIIENLKKFKKIDVIEIGSGKPVRIRDFVKTVHMLANSKTELNFGAVPYRENELMYSRADIERMNSIECSLQYSLNEGIEETIKFAKLFNDN